jgi:hypothetical protein
LIAGRMRPPQRCGGFSCDHGKSVPNIRLRPASLNILVDRLEVAERLRVQLTFMRVG